MSKPGVEKIITALGGVSAVASALGKGYSTVSEMQRRGSIPVEYWPTLMERAREMQEPIDEKTLVSAHTENAA